MLKYDYFTDIEDNATLESDKSAISVLQKAVFKNCLLLESDKSAISVLQKAVFKNCLFILPPGNKSDKLRGLGQSPRLLSPEGAPHT